MRPCGAVPPAVPHAGQFDVPLALGFGFQTPDQLDARPDAAVLGSALLRHIAEGKDAAEFLGKWTGK